MHEPPNHFASLSLVPVFPSIYKAAKGDGRWESSPQRPPYPSIQLLTTRITHTGRAGAQTPTQESSSGENMGEKAKKQDKTLQNKTDNESKRTKKRNNHLAPGEDRMDADSDDSGIHARSEIVPQLTNPHNARAGVKLIGSSSSFFDSINDEESDIYEEQSSHENMSKGKGRGETRRYSINDRDWHEMCVNNERTTDWSGSIYDEVLDGERIKKVNSVRFAPKTFPKFYPKYMRKKLNKPTLKRRQHGTNLSRKKEDLVQEWEKFYLASPEPTVPVKVAPGRDN